MGLVCYDIVCVRWRVGWTIIQKPEPVCQFKPFFSSLFPSFDNRNRQKQKKKEANQGVCVKVMTHIDLGELVGQKN